MSYCYHANGWNTMHKKTLLNLPNIFKIDIDMTVKHHYDQTYTYVYRRSVHAV